MPSPSATISRASAAQTSPSAAANCSSRAGVRSTPLAPFASRTTASFVEHSPSTEIRLKLSSPPAAGTRWARRLERVVRRDDGEHRGEPRMDHPRALRHPSDDEPVALGDGLLRPAIGGDDRVRRRRRRRLRAARLTAAARLRARSSGRGTPMTPVERTTTSSGASPSRRPLPRLRPRRVREPALPVAALATPALTRPPAARRSRDAAWRDDRSCENAVHRPHRRADGGARRAHERKIRPGPADARMDARGDESRRGGDASDEDPESRSPVGLGEAEEDIRRSGSPGPRRLCRGCRSRR